MSSVKNKNIAVVGGGMTGVTAARTLANAGANVTVYEKSRGLGGRLATRRLDGGFSADHGAQFMVAEGAAFQQFLASAEKSGDIAEWTQSEADEKWYVGLPAMNSFLKTEPLGFDLKVSTHVSAAAAAEGGVNLTMQDGSAAHYDYAVLTAPAPQAEAMVNQAHPDMAAELSAVEIAPNWTLMLVFADPIDPGFTVWDDERPTLGWIARNSSKPGRDFAADSWTIQAGTGWSEQFLELGKEEAAERLFEAFQELVGRPLPKPIVQTAHRWRYARTVKPLGNPFLKEPVGRLYIAGDWCLGPGVECAFESGLAAAKNVLTR